MALPRFWSDNYWLIEQCVPISDRMHIGKYSNLPTEIDNSLDVFQCL